MGQKFKVLNKRCFTLLLYFQWFSLIVCRGFRAREVMLLLSNTKMKVRDVLGVLLSWATKRQQIKLSNGKEEHNVIKVIKKEK